MYEEELFEAIKNNDIEKVKKLVEYGTDINVEYKYNYESKTALMLALEKGHLEIIKYLVEHGADINAKNNYGATSLIMASMNRYLEVVKYLIENKADINIKYRGRKALDYAKKHVNDLFKK